MRKRKKRLEIGVSGEERKGIFERFVRNWVVGRVTGEQIFMPRIMMSDHARGESFYLYWGTVVHPLDPKIDLHLCHALARRAGLYLAPGNCP